MKNFWIFLGCCCFAFTTHSVMAQSDTVSVYQLYAAFTNAEKAEWTAFQNNWNYFDYHTLKTSYHIHKLDCKSCESFYADLYLEIDGKGAVTLCVCKTLLYCGVTSQQLQMKTDFENSVKKQVFRSLKHKKFTARFGQVLKC